MPLESATYLDDLNPSNPAATDLLSQGDDHIRLIKAVLQATFPNLDAAVTATPDELNLLAGVSALSLGVPTGTICMWYGAAADVPSGWGICNGTTYNKEDLSGTIVSPDLRDKVVQGVGSLQAAEGGAYGASTASATSGSAGAHSHSTTAGEGGHSHTPTIQGTALTISQIPAHTHTVQGGGGGNGIEAGQGGTGSSFTTSSQGGGATHTHGITFTGTDGTHTHTTDTVSAHTHGVTVSTYQPAVALHYIMKL